MPPYDRVNRYRGPHRARWRRWFAAALPWLFVIGVVAGTMLPWRHGGHRPWLHPANSSSRPADSAAARAAEMVWRRAGNPDIRHPVDVIRTIDGDTFEAQVHMSPGLDLTTRVRLRGIDAPELKAACPQELQMAESATAPCAPCSTKARSRSQISGRINITAG